MREFIRRLGKKVQSLLKNIFSKKEKPQNEVKWNSFTSACDFYTLGPGEVYIDGESIGKIREVVSISKDDLPDEKWESLKSIFGDGELVGGCIKIPQEVEIQKKSFSIPLSFLPKRYWCKTLILTLTANQESEYQAVDMSQYEEHKIANFIVGRKEGWEEVIHEYLSGQEFESDEELQEEEEWLRDVRQVEGADGFYSAIMGEATLLHYEDLGVWDIEEVEQ